MSDLIDWGYLTELYRETDKPIRKDENVFYEFSSAMFANFKHILAEREAAQRLRDALDGQADGIADAIDAFDAVVTK